MKLIWWSDMGILWVATSFTYIFHKQFREDSKYNYKENLSLILFYFEPVLLTPFR